MFTKALRALSSSSRDRGTERCLEDPSTDRPSLRRRATGPDGKPRPLYESAVYDGVNASDSDSDEYGLPHTRKDSIIRNDSHKRALSREQATVEYRCPGCSESYRFKETEVLSACRLCHVRLYESRRRPSTRTPIGPTKQRQLQSPRQLEDAFRDLYRRFGVLVAEQTADTPDPKFSRDVPSTVVTPPLPSSEYFGQVSSQVSPPRANLYNNERLSPKRKPLPLALHSPPKREPPPIPSARGPISSSAGIFPIPASPPDPPKPVTISPGPRNDMHPHQLVSPAVVTSPHKRGPRTANPASNTPPTERQSTPFQRARNQMLEHFQSDFRSIFGNADLLNSDFCSTSRPKPNKRSLSEGSCRHVNKPDDTVHSKFESNSSDKTENVKVESSKLLPAVPEPLLLDGKSLLAGHIHDIVSSLADYSQSLSIQHSRTVSRRSTFQSSPHINWAELQAYNSIVTRYTLDVDFCVAQATKRASEQSPKIRAEIVSFMAALLATCFDVVHDMLAAAREAPTSPQTVRYLLVILAGPWISRSVNPLASEYCKQTSKNGAQFGNLPSSSRFDDEARVLLQESAFGRRNRSSLRTRCLSLTLGRITNLPETVQHAFTRWFANIPSELYRDMTAAVQEFTVSQIRQIPTTRQSKVGAKQINDRQFLDEILGAANIGHQELDNDHLPWYSKRKSAWRIRTSCHALQLLFVANDIRRDLAARSIADIQNSAEVNGSLPVDYYYTSLLNPEAERFDVARDFDLWNARSAKFTFCQYPFLLTLGTKAAILEYDNQRRKQEAVRAEWHASKGTSANPYFHLHVRRDHIIDDSFKLIREARGSFSGVTSKKLRVHFEGEEGVDEGGPQKEWFLILTRELFNPDLGLFYLSDSGHFWFHSACCKPNEYFELVGAVFGLAIYNQTPLFAPFPPFMFRKLAAAAPRSLGHGSSWRQAWRPTLAEYQQLSPEFARILKQGLSDPHSMAGLSYEVPVWQNGQSILQPLGPHGADKQINESNIEEFIDQAVTWVLRDSVKNQFSAFSRGFYSICGGNALSLFRGEELELLIRGSEDFDLDALRAAVSYDNWKRPESEEDLESEDDVKNHYPIVRFFWSFFERAQLEERRMILRFITGTDRLPPAGIVNLVIKISRQELQKGEFRYPSARTCFNQILLPDCFEEQAVFDRVFKNALDLAGTGFGMK